MDFGLITPTEPTKNVVAHELKPGYEPLFETLAEAYRQASAGKGEERHAGGKPFLDQPIFTISREHGLGFLTGQAVKKLGEAHTLLKTYGPEKAVAEIFGAIVYSAAAVLLIREQAGPLVEPVGEPDPSADIPPTPTAATRLSDIFPTHGGHV